MQLLIFHTASYSQPAAWAQSYQCHGPLAGSCRIQNCGFGKPGNLAVFHTLIYIKSQQGYLMEDFMYVTGKKIGK